jgi:quercetin dioxygenase-like cupin family protein
MRPPPIHAIMPEESGENRMEITRNGTRPARRGPAEYFTGSVRLDPLTDADAPARPASLWVTFEPGARTNWHTHVLGQTLIVTAGVGRVQRQGGPVEEVRPGDVVWFEPGEKHWHGAAPEVAMSHIAIQTMQDGATTEWLEPVSDADYQGS